MFQVVSGSVFKAFLTLGHTHNLCIICLGEFEHACSVLEIADRKGMEESVFAHIRRQIMQMPRVYVSLDMRRCPLDEMFANSQQESHQF